jgi:hypothetical protein
MPIFPEFGMRDRPTQYKFAEWAAKSSTREDLEFLSGGCFVDSDAYQNGR